MATMGPARRFEMRAGNLRRGIEEQRECALGAVLGGDDFGVLVEVDAGGGELSSGVHVGDGADGILHR
jgi:hypothetical protein